MMCLIARVETANGMIQIPLLWSLVMTETLNTTMAALLHV